MRALNTASGVQETRPWWKVRVIAALATLIGAAFVLVSSGLALVAPIVAGHIGPAAVTLVSWLRMPIAGLVAFVGVVSAYRFLPDVEQRFALILPGSVVAVALWIAASLGFSAYAENFGKYEVEYGALGGVIVLLLWMWISSLSVLIGAEVNAVLEHRFAARQESRRAQPTTGHRRSPPAEALASTRDAPAVAEAPAHAPAEAR